MKDISKILDQEIGNDECCQVLALYYSDYVKVYRQNNNSKKFEYNRTFESIESFEIWFLNIEELEIDLSKIDKGITSIKKWYYEL